VEAVLFDLDGTLTDSAPGLVSCIGYALDELGIEPPDAETMRTFLGPPLWVTFRDHFGLDEEQVVRAIELYRERYHDTGMFENTVYDGIRDTLQALRDANIRMAIATSKPEYSATRILEHFDLAQYFEFIGADDLEGSRASKTKVIAHVLANTGLDPIAQRMIMVGDRRHDVEGAASHGIDTIGVLWGYGDHAELANAGARVIVANPVALTAALNVTATGI
jgi:phosphoglycolate phosphatase